MLPFRENQPADNRFLAAAEAIYDTASAPEKWPVALQAIAGAFDDVGANLTYRRDDGRFGAIVSPSLEAGVADYNNEWHRHDIRSARAAERGLFLSDEVVTDSQLVTEEEMNAHPFYMVFLAKFGLRWSASVSVSADPHVVFSITVQRSAAKNPFTADEKAMLCRLGRHAERALRLGTQLFDAATANVGLREALARIGIGAVLLDGLGRVVFANTVAERMMEDSLMIVNERLTAQSVAERPVFEGAISKMARADSIAVTVDLPPLRLRRLNSERPLVAYVLPLRPSPGDANSEFLARVRVIVLLIDMLPGDPADPAILRDLLGLTLGEARVAALIGRGLAPRRVSEQLGVSEETVRSVLKRVFGKMGVSRQSELAVLLSKLPVR